MSEERFRFELTPNGKLCRVWRDDVEISHLLAGFTVTAHVGEATQVVLEYAMASGEGIATIEVDDE